MKNIDKKYLFFSVVALLFVIIAIPTTYKIIKNYNYKSYVVVEKKIIEAAKKCYNEDNCSGASITLKELYDKKYLNTVVNPVTKKKYNDNLEIKRSDKGYSVKVR